MGDANYDSNSILKYIVQDLKTKPRISRNPRSIKDPKKLCLSKSGSLLCQARLEMMNDGSFYDKTQDRWRRKWICPLHHSKKYSKQFILCPIFHPKFFSQKGCYVYFRIDQDIREQIDYGSSSFKSDSKLRSGSERVFSRLLNVCMQYPTVTRLNAVSNFATIAHIAYRLCFK